MGAGRGHGREQDRYPREEGSGPPARGGQAAGPPGRCLMPGAGTGEADIGAAGSIGQPPVSPRRRAENHNQTADDSDRADVPAGTG